MIKVLRESTSNLLSNYRGIFPLDSSGYDDVIDPIADFFRKPASDISTVTNQDLDDNEYSEFNKLYNSIQRSGTKVDIGLSPVFIGYKYNGVKYVLESEDGGFNAIWYV